MSLMFCAQSWDSSILGTAGLQVGSLVLTLDLVPDAERSPGLSLNVFCDRYSC